MKKQLFFTFVFTILCVFTGSAQTQEAQKVAETEVKIFFCEDVQKTLDGIAEQISSTDKIYIIVYTGKIYDEQYYHKKTRKLRTRKVLPRKDEGLTHGQFYKNYLMFAKRVDKSRIFVVDGGFREKQFVEIWIAPKNAKPPVATPTVDSKDIKFRKGKARTISCDI